MSASAVLEAVDVLKEGKHHLITGVPSLPPDQFCFEGFEESLDGGVVPRLREGRLRNCLCRSFVARQAFASKRREGSCKA